jgi:DNA-binding transcriptional LysR family regulator
MAFASRYPRFTWSETRELPAGSDWVVRQLPPQPGGLYVRSGHPLLSQRGPAAGKDLARLHGYGLASVRLPQAVRTALCEQLQLAHEKELLAVECDDVSSLIQLTLHTDTVLAAIEPVVRPSLDAGLLHAIRAAQVFRPWHPAIAWCGSADAASRPWPNDWCSRSASSPHPHEKRPLRAFFGLRQGLDQASR